MQPGGPLAKQGQPPQHEHLGLGIPAGQHAGPAQFVVQEALAEKATQQALHQAMLQMQVNGLGIEASRVGKNHGPHRILLAPLPERGFAVPVASQAVEGVVPTAVVTASREGFGMV